MSISMIVLCTFNIFKKKKKVLRLHCEHGKGTKTIKKLHDFITAVEGSDHMK